MNKNLKVEWRYNHSALSILYVNDVDFMDKLKVPSASLIEVATKIIVDLCSEGASMEAIAKEIVKTKYDGLPLAMMAFTCGHIVASLNEEVVRWTIRGLRLSKSVSGFCSGIQRTLEKDNDKVVAGLVSIMAYSAAMTVKKGHLDKEENKEDSLISMLDTVKELLEEYRGIEKKQKKQKKEKAKPEKIDLFPKREQVN